MPFKPGQSVIREFKRAVLSEDFGRELLAKKFTDDGAAMVFAMFGNVSRGPRKGKPRGFIHWTKVTRGGWNYAEQRVERPGSYGYHVSLDYEGSPGAPGRDSYASSATHAEYMEYLCRALHVCKENWHYEKGQPIKSCEFWERWHVAADADRRAAADAFRTKMTAEENT